MHSTELPIECETQTLFHQLTKMRSHCIIKAFSHLEGCSVNKLRLPPPLVFQRKTTIQGQYFPVIRWQFFAGYIEVFLKRLFTYYMFKIVTWTYNFKSVIEAFNIKVVKFCFWIKFWQYNFYFCARDKNTLTFFLRRNF